MRMMAICGYVAIGFFLGNVFMMAIVCCMGDSRRRRK